VAGRRIVPELIQRECTAERIADAAGIFLEQPEEAARVRRDLQEVRARLGEPGVFDRAARAILAELGGPLQP
jgi:lipid-A-disaccharide synthase